MEVRLAFLKLTLASRDIVPVSFDSTTKVPLPTTTRKCEIDYMQALQTLETNDGLQKMGRHIYTLSLCTAMLMRPLSRCPMSKEARTS